MFSSGELVTMVSDRMSTPGDVGGLMWHEYLARQDRDLGLGKVGWLCCLQDCK